MQEPKVRTTTRHYKQMELTSADILALIKNARPDWKISGDAAVFIQVPRGGDYSGCRLDIDSGVPVKVEWTEGDDDGA